MLKTSKKYENDTINRGIKSLHDYIFTNHKIQKTQKNIIKVTGNRNKKDRKCLKLE